MTENLESLKADLRKQVRATLAGMSATDRAAGSARLFSRIAERPEWRNAETILFFAPLPGEPDIRPLFDTALQAGKTVALPHFSEVSGAYIIRQVQNPAADVKAGRYGISEPHSSCPEVALNGLDLALVPGIAFGPDGRRLGRGKGYYDRLLAGVGGQKWGVAFDVQIVNEIPSGPLDIRVNCIVTPTRWIET